MPRRNLPLIAAIITVVIVLLIGYIILDRLYLSVGTVRFSMPGTAQLVVTDNANAVSVEAEVEDGSEVRLREGLYTLELESDGRFARQSVIVEARKTTDVTVDFGSLLNSSVVLNEPATDLFISQSALRYIRPDIKAVFEANQESEPRRILSNLSDVNAAYWFDRQNALLSTFEGSIYLLQNDNLLTFRPLGDDNYLPIRVGVDRASRTFVLVRDGKVQRASLDSPEELTEVATFEGSFTNALYQGDTLVLFNVVEDSDHSEQLTGDEIDESILVIDLSSGDQYAIQTNTASAALSNSGATLAIQADLFVELYDTENGELINRVPASPISMVWSSDDTQLFYTDPIGIWSYDVDRGQANLIYVSDQSNRPTQLFLDANDSVYFIGNVDGSPSIFRLGDAAGGQLDELSSLLPVTASNYSIELNSIDGTPTVIINTFAVLNRPSDIDRYRTDTLNFRSEALEFLTNNGIDTDQINIVFKPSDL